MIAATGQPRVARPRARRRPAPWGPGLLAVACAAAGLALCWHHPLAGDGWGRLALLALFVAIGAGFAVVQGSWLLLLPAVLPLVGFAPWSGWISVEEMDLLVLAAAAAGHGQLAWQRRAGRPGYAATAVFASPTARPGPPAPPAVVLLLLLFALSTAVALWRGVVDAGGWQPQWFDRYHGSMNSLRLAKSLLLALLLVAPARAFARAAPQQACDRVVTGVTLGLAGASLAALWERLAFTGLLDFSSNYRTTALFWEMHVGGAALDAFLALAVPFAVHGLSTDRTPARWAARASVIVVAAYACLTTFSRGVYLAVPAGLAAMALLQWRLARGNAALQAAKQAGAADDVAPAAADGIVHAALLLAAFGAAAAWLFPAAGYRGTLALWLAFVLLPPVATVWRRLGGAGRLFGAAGGGVAAALLLAAASAADRPQSKAAYGLFAAAAAWAVASLAWHRWQGNAAAAVSSLSAFVAVVGGVGAVARHWGGDAGWQRALPVTAGLLVLAWVVARVGAAASVSAAAAAAPSARPTIPAPARPAAPAASARSVATAVPPSPARWRRRGALAVAMLCVSAALGIFGGGAYMSGRFATGGADWQGREQHWRQGLAMLHGPADWLLGKGLGRFPGDLFFAAPVDERTGDHRLARDADDGNTHLVLSAGRHAIDWGELMRVSQRVALPAQPATVSARVRATTELQLHFEVCAKHLLYDDGCLLGDLGIKPGGGEWQTISVPLVGGPIAPAAWYAPRLIAFSVAVDTRGGVVDLDNLVLSDANDGNLLANGDFSNDLARWFFTSDRHHLPWHIKNVLMNVLFDQGAIGLALWCALLAAGAWRLVFGAARRHPLAPAAAAALLGFLVIGLFDSVLDAPRVAFLFYALLLFALLARPPRAGAGRPEAPVGAAPAGAGAVRLGLWCCIAAAAAVPGDSRADVDAIGAPPRDAAAAARAPLRVGANREVRTVGEAARRARDGDTVEVDAGDYPEDTAVWTQRELTVRAVGGRARLLANGAHAEGKGTWIVRSAGRVTVEGFDFIGAAVPDHNGAGIRFEAGLLAVRDCVFLNNENGILTGNGPALELDIERSEFGHNGHGDGQSHNLYVGRIARLAVSGSHFHHARVGHLLKSRAAVNRIAYNRLTDEAGGRASYELEFPDGGVALVIGNLIEQGPRTENPVMVSFGIEGYRHPANELVLSHNTLIDHRAPGGIFVRVAPGAGVVQAVNNLLVGSGDLAAAGAGSFERNATMAVAAFDRAVDADYRWTRRPAGLPTAADAGSAHGLPLRPAAEYASPRRVVALDDRVLAVGALQPPADAAGR